MNHRNAERKTGAVSFGDLVSSLAAEQVWQYEPGSPVAVKDVAGTTSQALQTPQDFPPIESAIVQGDKVALAVDPNLPQICEVITGILKTFAHTEASDIDIVLWDEATDATVASLQDVVGESATIRRHDCTCRESLRFLGADKDGEPIYLSRWLVDADFVLPVVSARPWDAQDRQDLTGVFPTLADSATRIRHRNKMLDANETESRMDESQVAWLLGVHLILTVHVTADGASGQIVAGSLNKIRALNAPQPRTDENASLIIASLDGDAQQQTWLNAARALAAASHHVLPGGAIVLWSDINDHPTGDLAQLADVDDINSVISCMSTEASDEPDGFPNWDDSLSVASTIARITAEHRVLIHSQLDRETVEPIGLGAVADRDELIRLSKSFDTCGVLRGAQFASGTIDAPHYTMATNEETTTGDVAK